MDRIETYRSEFEKCVTQKDYEQYFYKYYSIKDNPYVARAQKMIQQKRKVKSEYPFGLAITILILAIGFFVFMFCMESAKATDSQEKTFSRILVSVICSPFVLGSLWILIKSIRAHINNR